MFSLIISIIAIALVVVLAGASLYYGGDAFNKGTSKGEAAKLINEAQQIQGAYTMFKVDNKGAVPTTVADLYDGDDANVGTVEQYLAADFSSGWEFDATDGTVDSTVTISQDVCDAVTAAGNAQVTCADESGTLVVKYDL